MSYLFRVPVSNNYEQTALGRPRLTIFPTKVTAQNRHFRIYPQAHKRRYKDEGQPLRDIVKRPQQVLRMVHVWNHSCWRCSCTRVTRAVHTEITNNQKSKRGTRLGKLVEETQRRGPIKKQLFRRKNKKRAGRPGLLKRNPGSFFSLETDRPPSMQLRHVRFLAEGWHRTMRW